MPITVDGQTYANVGDWNRAMDAQAVAAAPSILPSAAAAPRDLAVSPDLLAGASPAPAPAGGNRGDWLDTVVMPRESGGRPNIGWGNTDLTPWLAAGKTVYGFPDWPGKPGPAGNSTAAGLYQITKTNWLHYAPLLGVNDFSPESQRKVADAIMADQGPKAWAASGPVPGGKGLASAMGGGSGSLAGMLGAAGTNASPATPNRATPALPASLALAAQPQQAATPASAPATHHAAAALQPIPLPNVPNLRSGYEEALSAILGGQRRGLGSIFG